LEKSRGAPPDEGPEGTVGVWMLLFMGMPILEGKHGVGVGVERSRE
jgi:hypothetical protein